jgi:hypothetical protein
LGLSLKRNQAQARVLATIIKLLSMLKVVQQGAQKTKGKKT